jgi:hypothetical protein
MGISPCGGPGRPTHPDCTPTRPRLGRKQVRALFSGLLLALFASASASYATSTVQSPAAPAVKAVTAEKPTRMKLQPGADTVKVRAVYSPDVRPNPVQDLSADEFDSGASGWRSYGMLLATLVLMGVIAVRRFTAGRH